ncbi:PWI domain-containing protein [Westerdykella ornata]|uniref:PWI domain-containing protein n=1 Tax=Westerdykella ornata TaxID=318751 RepID=A0A6A6JNJ6_WESOR|nr:PWI domain-containing protein [Westerdykella ornata]KAF2278191.1 PWI domain-containing protein [Westerdykella ornata]
MALTADQKRLKATKFPLEFDKKVDIEKVNLDIIKKWVAEKITAILGDDDDIVIETCYNLLEKEQYPKIKEIQIQLEGFLDKDCPRFCKELWNLMLSAQESTAGVPKELLEAKKLELQKEQASKAAAESRRRQAHKEEDEMINSFREDEMTARRDRTGPGGRGRGRGRRDDRNQQRRPPRHTFPLRRDSDSYVPPPRGRGRNRSAERGRSRSAERFRSPTPRRDHRGLRSAGDVVDHHHRVALGPLLAGGFVLLRQAAPGLLRAGGFVLLRQAAQGLLVTGRLHLVAPVALRLDLVLRAVATAGRGVGVRRIREAEIELPGGIIPDLQPRERN